MNHVLQGCLNSSAVRLQCLNHQECSKKRSVLLAWRLIRNEEAINSTRNRVSLLKVSHVLHVLYRWSSILQGPVVQMLDSAFHQINYQILSGKIIIRETNLPYPLELDLSSGQHYPPRIIIYFLCQTRKFFSE